MIVDRNLFPTDVKLGYPPNDCRKVVIMRSVTSRFSAGFALAFCTAWSIAGECQLGSGGVVLPDHGDNRYSGGRAIFLGRYEGEFSFRGVVHECSGSRARLKDLLEMTGAPGEGPYKEPLGGGLNDLGLRKRKDLIDAFGNLEGCSADGFDLDDLLNKTLVPWVLSNREVIVDLDPDQIARVAPDSHESGLFAQIGPRPLSPRESSQPREDVTIDGGFVLGTVFAEDPSPKYEDKTPIYDLSDSEGEVKFVRRFESLLPGRLSKPVNFTLALIADPSDSFLMRDGAARTIIRRGTVELVEWDMLPSPKRRNWFDDEVTDVTMHGTIAQTSDDGNEITGTTHEVKIPNNRFKIRRESWMRLAEEMFTSFFKSVPGWVSLIEAAVLAWLGFFRKVRSKPDANDAAAPTEA